MSFDLIAFISIHLRLTVSIPFDQGDVFRLNDEEVIKTELRGLNPFRSGRCLSTKEAHEERVKAWSLNPFRSGRCLSTTVATEKEVNDF